MKAAVPVLAFAIGCIFLNYFNAREFIFEKRSFQIGNFCV